VLDPKEIRRRIAESLPGCEVEVRDMTGTGDHFEAFVVSESFAGKAMVEQHQLVYRPLQDLLSSGALHALALKTFTPEQWKSVCAMKGT
jgi:acid stress-induced BolA-like protein IbaG/YrbA